MCICKRCLNVRKKIAKTCTSLELFVFGPVAIVVYCPLYIGTEYFWGPNSDSGGTDPQSWYSEDWYPEADIG